MTIKLPGIAGKHASSPKPNMAYPPALSVGSGFKIPLIFELKSWCHQAIGQLERKPKPKVCISLFLDYIKNDVIFTCCLILCIIHPKVELRYGQRVEGSQWLFNNTCIVYSICRLVLVLQYSLLSSKIAMPFFLP